MTSERTVSTGDIGALLAVATAAVPVACLNWPEHPYCPSVSFRIGHVGTEIWLAYAVSEERVRGLEMRTHGEVYKDSCVEFFISFDGTNYYNFEFNCIGTAHLAYGPGRHNRKFVSLPLMERLEILPSLGSQPFAEKSGGFDWALTARIPVTCFGFDALTSLDGVAATANFYKVGSGLSVPHYLTWNPVGTPTPDYHRPEFFGGVVFEKSSVAHLS
jgi:hypothetical protein